jgi:enoyl-CoA hydratase
MPDVELSVDRGIATVLLNRPDSLNSLSSGVLSKLDAVIAQIEKSDETAGVIVTGAGRAFVAGADIEEISSLDPTAGLRFAERGQAVFSRIERLDKPVVAAVNGFALGGGCELAMACHGLATQLILSGEMIAADEALRTGLVNEVVEPDALLERARAVLEQCLANGPRAVAASLTAIRNGLDLSLEDGLKVEAKLFSAACGTAEMREGTSAFLEKREPDFKR